MSKAYPWYFTIDERPVKVVGDRDVRAMDPTTGAMVPDPASAERVAARDGGVVERTKDEYMERLDALRQPILERYCTAPLAWQWTGDSDMPYRAVVDGHELVIRAGDFPDEAMYMLRIDGQETYEIDDWPSAWVKPVAS